MSSTMPVTTTQDTEIIEKINRLRSERKAVIIAHNYQYGEVQDVADFVGDSLELSRKAAATDAEVIVFCGVHFMAETASILSPDKKVIMPDIHAGCPMADMITAERLREKKAEHPGAVVVCYVNSSADVKAESDICCTSANAVKVVQTIPPDKEIIFVPDKYLGMHVMRLTGRMMILWEGFCPTHMRITAGKIEELKREHPCALVLVHPECRPETQAAADQILSTGGMCRFVQESDATEFIIGTETGIIHRMEKENPGKKFYAVSDLAVCPNMKMTTVEKVLWSLEDLAIEVKVPEDIRAKAWMAVDRMLQVK